MREFLAIMVLVFAGHVSTQAQPPEDPRVPEATARLAAALTGKVGEKTIPALLYAIEVNQDSFDQNLSMAVMDALKIER